MLSVLLQWCCISRKGADTGYILLCWRACIGRRAVARVCCLCWLLMASTYALSPGRVDVGGTVTARDIIIATGSVPFVPPGIPIDGKTVRTAVSTLEAAPVTPWSPFLCSALACGASCCLHLL